MLIWLRKKGEPEPSLSDIVALEDGNQRTLDLRERQRLPDFTLGFLGPLPKRLVLVLLKNWASVGLVAPPRLVLVSLWGRPVIFLGYPFTRDRFISPSPFRFSLI